jgi:hypothetical protein
MGKIRDEFFEEPSTGGNRAVLPQPQFSPMREKGVAWIEIREERLKRVGCRVVLDNDTVPLEDAIGFGCRDRETVIIRMQLDRCAQGKFAITSMGFFVGPDQLSEAKESIEAR